MQPVNLFDLAAQQARWLGVRQTAISSNVANINTPGYVARDVAAFESVLDGTKVAMRATHPLHVGLGAGRSMPDIREVENTDAMLPSGNSVVMETELMKAGEIRRSFEMNTAIVSTFHRMLMATTRG